MNSKANENTIDIFYKSRTTKRPENFLQSSMDDANISSETKHVISEDFILRIYILAFVVSIMHNNSFKYIRNKLKVVEI